MKIELSDKIISQYHLDIDNISKIIECLLESNCNPDYDLFTKCWSRHRLELDIYLTISSINKTDFKERFLCIDIDNLTILKDEYGYAAADNAILAVANSLKNIYQDKKIYRYGGDEFVVWLSDCNISPLIINNKFINEYSEIKTKYCEINVDLVKTEKLFRTVHWIMNQIDLGMIKASVNGSKLNCGNPPIKDKERSKNIMTKYLDEGTVDKLLSNKSDPFELKQTEICFIFLEILDNNFKRFIKILNEIINEGIDHHVVIDRISPPYLLLYFLDENKDNYQQKLIHSLKKIFSHDIKIIYGTGVGYLGNFGSDKRSDYTIYSNELKMAYKEIQNMNFGEIKLVE